MNTLFLPLPMSASLSVLGPFRSKRSRRKVHLFEAIKGNKLQVRGSERRLCLLAIIILLLLRPFPRLCDALGHHVDSDGISAGTASLDNEGRKGGTKRRVDLPGKDDGAATEVRPDLNRLVALHHLARPQSPELAELH